MAADNLGLLPDPWMQTASLCQIIAAVNGNDSKPEEFLFKRQRRKSSEEMRKSLIEHGKRRKRELRKP